MKKNLILAAAFLLAAKIATAQTEKGTQNLGVSFSIQHNNLNGTELDYTSNSLQPETSKYTYANVGLNYSYFIADKLDIGADLTYGHNYNDNSANSSRQAQTSNTYGGDIFLRKYFMCSTKFGFRAGPYVGYNKINNSYTYVPDYPGNVTSNPAHGIDGGLRLDLVYYPVKQLGVSAILANAGYSHSAGHDSNGGKSTSNSYNVQLISNVNGVSLFYIF